MTEEVKEVTFSVSDVASWDDDKCKEMEGKVSFPMTSIRDVLKELALTTSRLQTLRVILFNGLLRGYEVTCPECKNKYAVSVSDFNIESEVVCPHCGKAHLQKDNISNVVVNDNTEMVKPKKKRASKKKAQV